MDNLLKLVIVFFVLLFVVCIQIAIDCYFAGREIEKEELEFVIPTFTITETISAEIFSGGMEYLSKIYLTKKDADKLLKIIKKSKNWKHGEVDKELNSLLIEEAETDIYSQIPKIKDQYWIFTDTRHKEGRYHDYTENLSLKSASIITMGFFDVKNNVLYYYRT